MNCVFIGFLTGNEQQVF